MCSLCNPSRGPGWADSSDTGDIREDPAVQREYGLQEEAPTIPASFWEPWSRCGALETTGELSCSSPWQVEGGSTCTPSHSSHSVDSVTPRKGSLLIFLRFFCCCWKGEAEAWLKRGSSGNDQSHMAVGRSDLLVFNCFWDECEKKKAWSGFNSGGILIISTGRTERSGARGSSVCSQVSPWLVLPWLWANHEPWT